MPAFHKQTVFVFEVTAAAWLQILNLDGTAPNNTTVAVADIGQVYLTNDSVVLETKRIHTSAPAGDPIEVYEHRRYYTLWSEIVAGLSPPFSGSTPADWDVFYDDAIDKLTFTFKEQNI